MTPNTWSLGRRITVLCGLAATMLGLIAVSAATTAASNRADTTRVMDRLTPTVVNAERLYTRLLRQQSSMRTYLISGREEDLTSYQQSVQEESDIIASTQRLLAAEPALRGRLQGIAEATARYRREVADPLIAAARASGPDPARATPTDEARALYRIAADRITEFGRVAGDRRNGIATHVRESGRVLILLMLSAAVVVIIAGFALAMLLRRLVTQPVVDLAAEVRRVARGDYDHNIGSSGPPELARLARDVNGMRQRIAQDLAEVRAARQQVEDTNRLLEQQADELTRSNRDLEQFAYVASHDLQEPLRKVASFCQLLQRRYAGQLDDRADQYIAFAVDGAQRMQRLINDLLAFSRIGRITSGFGDVDLNKVVLDAASQFDTVREETQAQIIFEDLPMVRGEEPLLGALFGNLIGNALKFRHPERTPRIHISARLVADEYEFSCADNGIGIAPEFTDKVFVIFQRLHAKETYPGTGIGLAIAKKIVEYHGGRIWIERDHRDGTLFRFTIPAPAEALVHQPSPLAEETVT